MLSTIILFRNEFFFGMGLGQVSYMKRQLQRFEVGTQHTRCHVGQQCMLLMKQN